MAGQTDLALSYLGFRMYMSEIGVAPTSADELIGLADVSGYGVTTNTVDATPLNGTGFARFVATLKEMKPVTLKFFLSDGNTFKRLRTKAFDTDTSNEAYYFDLTFVFPKKKNFDGVRDITMTVMITDFDESEINTGSAQSYSVTVKGQDKPKVFEGTIQDAT